MKSTKLSVFLVAVILLLGSTFWMIDQAFAQQQFIRGDADGDGLVGALDPAFIICYRYSGVSVPPCLDAADANDDGGVNYADASYLINYLFVEGFPPPQPFPNPGFDPTPDTLDCAVGYVAPTPSTIDSLIVTSASGFAGDTVTVPIIVRNSQALLGYQIHLEFDPNVLQVIGVDTIGTATGAVYPDLFGFTALDTGRIVDIWCVADCPRLRSIPAGRDTLVKIMFQVNQSATCTTTLLDLKNVTGPPFWGNLLDYSGGKVYPTLVDNNLTSQCQFIRGDADGDGLVGWLDCDFIMCWYFLGGPPFTCGDAADPNDDGTVNSADILYLQQYLSGFGAPPHAPFPNPGFDPTPDGLGCAGAYVIPTPSTLDSVIILSSKACAGQTVAVPIIVENSQNLFSYQIYLEYDSTLLEAITVDTAGTATGAAEPDEFYFSHPPGKIEIWCIIDCPHLGSIPAGRDTLVKIVFQVKDTSATTLLDLKNLTGPPFKGNLLGWDVGKVYPILVDNNFTAGGSEYPEIDTIADVGNDQGKQVRVKWNSSCYDGVGFADSITQYSIWRRADTKTLEGWDTEHRGISDITVVASMDEMLAQVSQAKPGDQFLVAGEFVWVFIATVPAMQFEEYAYDAPTECDATEEDTCWSVFFVAAHTQNPTVHYDSDPDSGYSMDNIPPIGVKNLDIQGKKPDTLFLTWMVPGEYPGEQTATAYDIRYSNSPIGSDTTFWWDSLTIQCQGEPYPTPAGQVDTFTLTLDLTQTYYIAMKLLDDRPNYSEISNIIRFTCGDANGDIQVNSADVAYLINYLFVGGPPPHPMAAGDANCDGVVNSADVAYLINYLFVGGPEPCK
jgi:hypothetical protein